MENINLTQIKERYLPKGILVGIILVIAAILISLGSLIFNNFFPPSVIVTKPIDGSKGVTPFTDIVVTFDRSISNTNQSHFSISPKVNGTLSITSNTLRFIPSQSLILGQKFTVTISNPVANWGAVGKTVSFTFTVKNINELTTDENNLIQAQSDAAFNQEVQNASQTVAYQRGVAIYNLIQATPYDNGKFSVKYDRPSDSFVVTVEQNPYQTNKQAAIDWIKSQGVTDLTWITIKYLSSPGVGP